jgi:ribosomal protein L12E/L44/L45/RPP1/RPP2
MGDGNDSDSLLDVFTSVEVEETFVSALARELSEVNMHSLLEQTRQVAGEVGRGHHVS